MSDLTATLDAGSQRLLEESLDRQRRNLDLLDREGGIVGFAPVDGF